MRRAAGLAYAQHLATDPGVAALIEDTEDRISSGRGFPDARPAAEVLADLYAHLAEPRRAG